MKRNNLIFLVLLSLSLTACLTRTTPPAPNTAGGTYENVGYQFFQWPEGLNIMIWHESVTESSCDSAVGYGVDTNIVQCRLLTKSGFEFTWDIATKDGRTAEFMLAGQPYDLDNGNVFLIKTVDGQLDVQQLPRDLSDVTTTHDSITQFGLSDADIRHFIETPKPAN